MKSNKNFAILLLIAIVLSIRDSVMAQGLFIQHTVDNSLIGACSVCSYDLDGDGDFDILAAGNSGNQIAWWKNNGNVPISFSKYTIDSNASGIIFVDAADVDNDGDMDVLGASWQGNEVAIWKNEGGFPISWEKIIVDDSITQAHEIHTAYIDADSLLDIIAASGGNNQIVWYRNGGGNPITWEKNIVDNQFNGARSVVSFDINNDGHNDLIGAALPINQVSIWFNSGNNPIQWGKQIVDNTIGGAHWVNVTDLDIDDDADIIAAGAIPGVIAWWRNDGGNPIHWTKQIISSGFSGALSIAAADLDLDNDIDVCGAAVNANRVDFWKNEGNTPILWTQNMILSNYMGAWPVFGIDLDEDGDIDILTAASSLNKVTWLENTIIISNTKDEAQNVPDKFSIFQNYPNPFNPSTRIQYQVSSNSYVSLKVYDVLGNEVATLVNEYKPAGKYEVEFSAIDNQPSGIYFYRLQAGSYSQTKKLILMK